MDLSVLLDTMHKAETYIIPSHLEISTVQKFFNNSRMLKNSLESFDGKRVGINIAQAIVFTSVLEEIVKFCLQVLYGCHIDDALFFR